MLARIQVLMLQKDLEAMQNNPDFSLDSGDGVYIVFMIIGILGYFTIPTVAGWIIQAGGGAGNYSRHVNTAGALAGGVTGAVAGNAAGRVDAERSPPGGLQRRLPGRYSGGNSKDMLACTHDEPIRRKKRLPGGTQATFSSKTSSRAPRKLPAVEKTAIVPHASLPV